MKPRDENDRLRDGELPEDPLSDAEPFDAQDDPHSSDTDGTGDGEPLSTPVIVTMSDIEPVAVSYLWEPYLPRGKLTILEGDPAAGKSTFSLWVAAHVTRGSPFPGRDGRPGEGREPGDVLLLAGEDGLADTVRPRLDAVEADCARVRVLTAKSCTDPKTGTSSEWPITLADLPTVAEAIGRYKPSLLIVDPIQQYLGARTDMHRSNEVRPLLSAIAGLAEKHALAVLLIRHLSKAPQGRALYRGIGSIDFSAAARSVILAGVHPRDPARRVLVHTKSSCCRAGQSIAYELATHADGVIECGRFVWAGVSDVTAAELLAPEPTGGRDSPLGAAEEFLVALLAKGPMASAEVLSAAERAGISERTLERAKSSLGVLSRKRRKAEGGGWEWATDGGSRE